MKTSFLSIIVLSMALLAFTIYKKPSTGHHIGPTHSGEELLRQYCLACHTLERPNDTQTMNAPPFMGVQRHYKQKYPDKKAFIQAVINWVNKPEVSKSLMPGAVSRFKLMPPLPIGDEKLEKIGTALYEMNFKFPKGKHNKGKCGAGTCGTGKCGR